VGVGVSFSSLVRCLLLRGCTHAAPARLCNPPIRQCGDEDYLHRLSPMTRSPENPAHMQPVCIYVIYTTRACRRNRSYIRPIPAIAYTPVGSRSAQSIGTGQIHVTTHACGPTAQHSTRWRAHSACGPRN
jgi:hypothetical protein